MDWILASASPRRKELFGEIVESFEIIPAKGEENGGGEKDCSLLACKLATQKAREIASLPVAKGKAVLGADTIVVLEGKVLGKPKDEADAVKMLTALSGKTHAVYTGVCISFPKGDNRVEKIEVACTPVEFETLSTEKIKAYVKTGSPMDKAGAYGIQDGGLVKAIHGSYSNVVGLPVELVKNMVKEIQNEINR